MREGTVNVNLEESVALSNKPLQRLNASASRSSAGRAATPRAGARGSSRPWYGRATVRRSPLNGKTLDRGRLGRRVSTEADLGAGVGESAGDRVLATG